MEANESDGSAAKTSGGPIFLGIDIGTTTSKVCLIDAYERIIEQISEPHNGTLAAANLGWSEQCPRTIALHLFALIRRLDTRSVRAIGISGQMHGVMLWNSSGKYEDDQAEWPCSPLITWMDQSRVPETHTLCFRWRRTNGQIEQRIATGYGMATLLWLRQNKQLSPAWDTCGTIMDFFTFLLTGKTGVISDQLAYSFGYSTRHGEWQEDVRKKLPADFCLPRIVPSEHLLGALNTRRFPHGRADVFVALGDLQTSLFKVIKEKEAVLHIGTSSQLVFLPPAHSHSPNAPDCLLQTPFFNNRRLVVAASLNGGNVFELLAKKISEFYRDLFGVDVQHRLPEGRISELLNQFDNFTASLHVAPLFYGERHAPTVGAALNGMTSSTTLVELFGSTAVGIVSNLSSLMSASFMQEAGVESVRLLNRATHPLFIRQAEKSFAGMRVVIDEQSELSAAFGAACFALQRHSST